VRHFFYKKQNIIDPKILAFSSFLFWIPPGYHIFQLESGLERCAFVFPSVAERFNHLGPLHPVKP
jgi:hypothetical protein